MKLLGKVGKQQVLILVDSSSKGTFVSTELVERLKLSTVPCEESKYKAADGGLMVCTTQASDLRWFAQGHTFSSTTKILPLRCFDMILGEDWLKEVSPMWVDWRTKTMKFTYQGNRLTLTGVTDDIAQCSQVSFKKLKGLLRQGAVTHCIQLNTTHDNDAELEVVCAIKEHDTPEACPVEVQSLLQEFDLLFAEPVGLPPKRAADHQIPLRCSGLQG